MPSQSICNINFLSYPVFIEIYRVCLSIGFCLDDILTQWNIVQWTRRVLKLLNLLQWTDSSCKLTVSCNGVNYDQFNENSKEKRSWYGGRKERSNSGKKLQLVAKIPLNLQISIIFMKNPFFCQNFTANQIEFTYPYCVRANGTSILCDARRRSFAISANLAKSVSVSAKRAERLDSSKRTSSKRIFKSIGGYNLKKEDEN